MRKMKIVDSNYNIKLAIAQEYKKVIEYRKVDEDLIEAFQCIINDLFDYSKKNGIELPNRERIYRNMEKAASLIEYRISKIEPSTENQQRKSNTDKPTEHNLLFE
jgi:hypothetical protein